MKDEKVAGSRNPERQPIRKQFYAHLGRSGESSTFAGKERTARETREGRKGAIKLPEKNLTHGRELIFPDKRDR